MLEELSKEELILTIKELKEDNSKLIIENNELKKVVNKVSELLTNNKEEIAKLFAVNNATTNIEDTISVKINNVKSTIRLIDLGLPSGTLWMDRNIGAINPTDFGLYFAWGETTGYTADEVGKVKLFNWLEYKYADSNYDELTKYCNMLNHGNDGYTDSLVTLQTTDDAVLQNVHKCQMPTKEQIQELIDNTTYRWTTQDGVKGGLFTSKTNGNSIFVPAAGYCNNGTVESACWDGYLWSSSLSEDCPSDAWYCNFISGEVDYYFDNRCFGFPVRGVVKV